jgi:hypothetical protein
METRDDQLTTRDLAATPPERDTEPAGGTATEEPPARMEPDDAEMRERAPAGGEEVTAEAAARDEGVAAGAPARDEGVAAEAPAGGEASTRADEPQAGSAADGAPELLPPDEREGFQGRWEEVQTAFVDEPRQAVERADALVAEVMQRLADGFAQERERLEGQWSRGEDVSTEDLRVSLRRYRSFFQRLLSA